MKRGGRGMAKRRSLLLFLAPGLGRGLPPVSDEKPDPPPLLSRCPRCLLPTLPRKDGPNSGSGSPDFVVGRGSGRRRSDESIGEGRPHERRTHLREPELSKPFPLISFG